MRPVLANERSWNKLHCEETTYNKGTNIPTIRMNQSWGQVCEKAEPVYVDVCFFMSTYDLWCGWAKQFPQISNTYILAITHSHYRYWNFSQSIILSLPHSHTNRSKLWVTTNREVIWRWDHGGSSHSPLLQQPLTKGSWAGLVTLTAYMAAKIGIEEFITNLKTKF